MNDVSGFRRGGIARDMVETFAHLAISPDASDAARLVNDLLDDGVPAEMVMLELLAPAARHMGEMWAGDEVTFLDVTLGMSRIQKLLRQVRCPAIGPAGDRGNALLLPVPGEQHVLGLRLVEEFLLRDGWSVRCTQAANSDHLRQLVAAETVDIVGFSLSGERLLPDLRAAIRDVRAASRNRNVRIIVGGAIFAGQDCSSLHLDADAAAANAFEAVAQANRLLAPAGVA